MKLFLDLSTIKAAKRYDLNNPITAAFHSFAMAGRDAGHEIVMDTNCTGHDAVFVFGSITPRKTKTERAISIKAHRNVGTPLFSIDSGFFSTYIRLKTQSSESNFFRIGYGDCTGDAQFFNENSTQDRFDWFTRAYNVMPQPITADNNKPILFILQTERGWQYDNPAPYTAWARECLKRIRDVTDREVILRAHPNTAREPLNEIRDHFKNVTYQQSERSRMSSIEAIKNAGCVVTHSSSAVTEAYVEGVPVFAMNKRCLGFDAFTDNLSKINQLEDYNWSNRQQHLNDWAMTTWRIDELAKPDLFNYYMKKAKLI